MSDTPRTDAILPPALTELGMHQLCDAYNRLLAHARTIERECDALKEQVQELQTSLAHMSED